MDIQLGIEPNIVFAIIGALLFFGTRPIWLLNNEGINSQTTSQWKQIENLPHWSGLSRFQGFNPQFGVSIPSWGLLHIPVYCRYEYLL